MDGDGSAPAWSDYVAGFHDERPGITEALLSSAVDEGGRNPYAWLAEAGTSPGPVVDLGCGNGSLHDCFNGWIGLDPSLSELCSGRRRGAHRIIGATAEAVPVTTAGVGTVVAMMSLMVVADPAAAIAEVARILVPGGRLVVLLPAPRPLTPLDRLRYGLLLAALGRTAMPFPQPDVVRHPGRYLAAAGFSVDADEARRFARPMLDADERPLVVESLYLPGISARRIGVARTMVRHWGRWDLGIPLRRITARKAGI